MNNLLQALMHLTSDQKMLSDLEKLGFSLDKLHNTIAQIQELAETDPEPYASMPEYPLQPHLGTRVLDTFEAKRLTKRAQNLIFKLEQIGILTPQTRELVIDQAIHLEVHPVFPSHVKWVVLAILAKQPDKIRTAYMERLLLNEKREQIH